MRYVPLAPLALALLLANLGYRTASLVVASFGLGVAVTSLVHTVRETLKEHPFPRRQA